MVPEQWGQAGLPRERRGSCVVPSWSRMGLAPLASPRAGRPCPRPVAGASLATSLNHPHSGEASSVLVTVWRGGPCTPGILVLDVLSAWHTCVGSWPSGPWMGQVGTCSGEAVPLQGRWAV